MRRMLHAAPGVLHGPTDPDLPFVLARDATTGKPVGSLTVFAMHSAIYGSPPFGACYPGQLQTELRRLLDAPDLTSIFGESTYRTSESDSYGNQEYQAARAAVLRDRACGAG